MNLHLKVEQLHFEANIMMMKYVFKIESLCTTSLMLCYLAFSIDYNTNGN